MPARSKTSQATVAGNPGEPAPGRLRSSAAAGSRPLPRFDVPEAGTTSAPGQLQPYPNRVSSTSRLLNDRSHVLDPTARAVLQLPATNVLHHSAQVDPAARPTAANPAYKHNANLCEPTATAHTKVHCLPTPSAAIRKALYVHNAAGSLAANVDPAPHGRHLVTYLGHYHDHHAQVHAQNPSNKRKSSSYAMHAIGGPKSTTSCRPLTPLPAQPVPTGPGWGPQPLGDLRMGPRGR